MAVGAERVSLQHERRTVSLLQYNACSCLPKRRNRGLLKHLIANVPRCPGSFGELEVKQRDEPLQK